MRIHIRYVFEILSQVFSITILPTQEHADISDVMDHTKSFSKLGVLLSQEDDFGVLLSKFLQA